MKNTQSDFIYQIRPNLNNKTKFISNDYNQNLLANQNKASKNSSHSFLKGFLDIEDKDTDK